MRRTGAAVAAGAAAVVLLTGCGGDPAYSKSKACGVSADLVTAVLGTDQYSTVTRGDELPPQQSPSYSCAVKQGDRAYALNVKSERTSAQEIASRKERIAASDVRFSVAGGQAGIAGNAENFTALWVCDTADPNGTITASVDASKTKGSAADRRQLVTAVAEQAGTVCGR